MAKSEKNSARNPVVKKILIGQLIFIIILTIAVLSLAKSIDIVSYSDPTSSSAPIKNLHFPSTFIFGTATASFQVEYNQKQKVDTNWSRYIAKHNTISSNELGANWWEDENAERDIDRFAELGIKSLRMSMEWARIEPKKGVYDLDAIKRYKAIILYAREKGLEPMVTIHHFSNPGWFDDIGEWDKKENVEYFLEYVRLVAKEFPEVKYWITINEPNVFVNNGYLVGGFPPEKRSALSAFKARNNIVKASNEAYKIIKKQHPSSHVGAAFALRLLFPHSASPQDKFIANLTNYIESVNYIDGTSKYSDFIGVNYYTAYNLKFSPTSFKIKTKEGTAGIPEEFYLSRGESPNALYTAEMGWPIYPEALYDTLQMVSTRYKKPLIITENGISDGTDKYRPFYILTHLAMVQKALDNGIDIRGYYYWSGIDNLEWAEGYTKKFGLIQVDPITGKRTIRDSAYLYKNIIAEKNLDLEKTINTYIKDPDQNLEAIKIIKNSSR